MPIRKPLLLALVAPLLLGSCTAPIGGTQPEGARLDLVINEVKKQIAAIGQYKIQYAAPSDASCGAIVQAVPQGVTITLKTAFNTTVSGTGSGNIPISFVVISPSLTGSYATIHTQTVSFDSNIVRGTLSPPQTVLPAIAGPSTAKLGTSEIPDLRTAVVGVLQGFVNADHSLKPCFAPQTLKVQADFQVTKKADGGIQINFVVAKIGSDVSVTDDFTQSVVVTMDLKGSLGID